VLYSGSRFSAFKSRPLALSFPMLQKGGLELEVSGLMKHCFSCVSLLIITVVCSGQQRPPAANAAASTPTNGRYWLNILPYGQQIFELQQDLKNPTILYASTARGVYKSSNAGMVWEPLYAIDGSFITFAQSTSTPSTMYVGMANGQQGAVFKSTDSGASWVRIGAQDIQRAVSEIAIDPQNADVVYVLANSAGNGPFVCQRCVLFKSLNGGRTWGNVAPNGDNSTMNFLAVDPLVSGHLFADHAGNGSNLWESSDGGLSWQPRTSATFLTPNKMVANLFTYLGFHPSAKGVLIGTSHGQWGGQYPPVVTVSLDGGASFRDARIAEKRDYPPRESAEMQALNWSSVDPATIYGGTSESLYVSRANASDWQRILPYGTRAVVNPRKDEIYAVTTAGLLKSRSEGTAWHHGGIGLPTKAAASDSSAPADVFDAFEQGYKTTAYSLQAADAENIYVSGAGGFLTTSDSGLTWSWHSVPADLSTGISSSILPQSRGGNIRQLLVAADKTLVLNIVAQGAFASGEAQVLKVGPDGKIVKLNTRNRGVNMVAMSPANSSVLYITTSEGTGGWSYPSGGTALMKSTDGGFSWETFDLLQALKAKASGSQIIGISRVAVSPSSPDVVYALVNLRNAGTGKNSVAVEVTSDGGATWRDCTPELLGTGAAQPQPGAGDVTAVTVHPKDPQVVYLGINGRLFRSADRGAKWTELPFKGGPIKDISINSESPQSIYVAAATAWVSVNEGNSWAALTDNLRSDGLRRIISTGKMTLAQGASGLYRLSDFDVSWVKGKWQTLEEDPSTNPITFTASPAPVVTPAPAASARLEAPPTNREPQEQPQGSAAAAKPPNTAGCTDYTECFRAAQTAYRAKDWNRATAFFQAAATLRPTSGEPYLWLGRIFLQNGRTQEIAAAWDKALALGGSPIIIGACHTRGMLPCERGDLVLSAKEVFFTMGGSRTLFSARLTDVKPTIASRSFGQTQLTLQIGGASYVLSLEPLGSSCQINAIVSCPPDGVAKQNALAQYVSKVITASSQPAR